MKILAIESSCDETAAAVVEDGRRILSSEVASQIPTHVKFGGVVPEIASRLHIESISTLVSQALVSAHCTMDDIDAIAVTYAPGLIGALLVGVCFAKGLAMATGKPLIPVHHIAGHIATNYLSADPNALSPNQNAPSGDTNALSADTNVSSPVLEPPFLALVVSGGHTQSVIVRDYTSFEVVGSTGDDAAGESFDKVARVLGFPYPGGVYIDRAAVEGDPFAYKLPKPKIDGREYDFSFSGLKTAVINLVHTAEQKKIPIVKNDLAASFQRTVCEILTEKTLLAAKDFGFDKIVLAGGVSANSGVRAAMEKMCAENGFKLYSPPLSLCGDNAAMIGSQAFYNYKAGILADENLNAYATMELGTRK